MKPGMELRGDGMTLRWWGYLGIAGMALLLVRPLYTPANEHYQEFWALMGLCWTIIWSAKR